MNFVLTIIFVISTKGICNVNADWNNEYMEQIGGYFNTFLLEMSNTILNLEVPPLASPAWNPDYHAPEVKVEIQKIMNACRDDNRYYYQQENIGELQTNYNAFLACTRTKVELIVKSTPPNNEKPGDILTSIMKLCKGINKDKSIPEDYKYLRLPLRDELKQLYFKCFPNGQENDFNKNYCRVENVQETAQRAAKSRRISSGGSSKFGSYGYRGQ